MGLTRIGFTGIGTSPDSQYALNIASVNKTAGIRLLNLGLANGYGIKNIVNNNTITAYSVTTIGNQDVFVVKGDGSLGVGTDNPEDRLHVGDGHTKLVVGSASGQDLGFGTSYIGFNASRQNSSTWSTSGDNAHDGGAVIYGDVFGSIIFSTLPYTGATGQTGVTDATVKSNTRLFIHRDGNIGIGTERVSGYKLSVEGFIRAREIEVNPDVWYDFVFNKDYELKTLPEVEAYIAKNKHLPDVPSEKDVLSNGIKLGEMNAVLLQKVEELTLYMIAMDKRMKQLENENQPR